MTEEKAKKMMTTVRKWIPHSPTELARAFWVSSMPPSEAYRSGSASRMMKAVMLQTTRVSKYTPRDWIRPCLAGWDTEAVAAALGTEPIPASLENRPRRTPCMITAPRVAPANSRRPKAWDTIEVTIAGTSAMLMITTMRPMTM